MMSPRHGWSTSFLKACIDVRQRATLWFGTIFSHAPNLSATETGRVFLTGVAAVAELGLTPLCHGVYCGAIGKGQP